jgi:tetratricopeptide (TPR) repeat protein
VPSSDPPSLDPRSREALLVAEADRLASRGRFPEAIVLLESVRGQAVAVDLLLGTLHAVTGDTKQAAELLESARDRGARAAQFAPVLGEVYLMQGDWHRAIDTFRAVPADALEPGTRSNLALALLRSGDARGAVDALAPLPEPSLEPAQASVLADALVALESWSRAAEVLERLLAARTIDLEGMSTLALCWHHLDRNEEADTAASFVLQQSRLAPTEAAAAARVRALVARARGDAGSAEHHFSYAAQLAPTSPIHLADHAMFLLPRAPGEGELVALRAVACAPEHGLAWEALGLARFHQGRVAEALDAFERAAQSPVPGRRAGRLRAEAARHLPSAAPERVERVVRAPSTSVAWEPPSTTVPSVEPASERLGAPTLGAFHPPERFCARTLDAMAAALHAVPAARLLVKGRAWDCSSTREHLARGFAERGVPRERLVFFGHSGHAQHVEAWDLVDVALDPLTVSGDLATLEALAMGVPVVTCPGERESSRVAASLLSATSHVAWIAASVDEYAAKVAGLVADVAARRALRQSPREALLASSLRGGIADALASAIRGEAPSA